MIKDSNTKKLRQKAKKGTTSPLAHDDSTKETEEDKKGTEVDHSAKDNETTTKEEERTEDEASTKDSKEEASDEETLPSTSLQTLFGTLDAEFNDEVQSFNELAADKEPTPRATNTSIDDSFRYEPSTFVTEQPTQAVKEEDEDEEEEKEEEEHDEEDFQTAADTAKDESTISSKATDTSTESLDYKQLYNDLKKDLESQHLYWNERMEYLEAQAQDRMDQLEQRTMEQTADRMEQLEKRTALAQEAHESRFRNAFKARNERFDKKIEEVKTNLGGTQDKLETIAIAVDTVQIAAEKQLQTRHGINQQMKEAEDCKKDLAAYLHTKLNEVRSLRQDFKKEFKQLAAYYLKIKKDLPRITTRTVEDRVEVKINEYLSSAETNIEQTSTEAIADIRRELSEGIIALQRTIEEEIDEAEEEASQRLDAAPAAFQEAAEEALDIAQGQLKFNLREEYKNHEKIFLDSLQDAVDNKLRLLRSIIHSRVVKEIDSQINGLLEDGRTEFEALSEEQARSFSKNIKSIRVEAKQDLTDEMTEIARDQLKNLLQDEYIDFDTHPLVEHITEQVLNNVPQPLSIDNTNTKEELETVQENIDAALSAAMETLDENNTQRRVEFERMVLSHKQELEDQRKQALADLLTEGEQQQAMAENRREDEEQNRSEAAEAAAESTNIGHRFSNVTNPFIAGPTMGRPNHGYNQAGRRAETIDQMEKRRSDFWDKFRAELFPQPVLSKTNARDFYRLLFDHLSNYHLPLVPLDNLNKVRRCLDTRDREQMENIIPGYASKLSTNLYVKIRSMLHEDDKASCEALEAHSINRDGYAALYDIMKKHFSYLSDIPATWGIPWRPEWTPKAFHTEMAQKAEEIRQQGGIKKTETDMFVEMILQAEQLPRYAHITGAMMGQLGLYGPVAFKGHSLSQLVAILENADRKRHPPQKPPGEEPTINKFTGKPSGRRDRERRPKVQCDLCKASGHSIDSDHVCYISAQIYHVLKRMGIVDLKKIEPKERKKFEDNATRFAQWHSTNTIKKLSMWCPTIDFDQPLDELTANLARYLYFGDDQDSTDLLAEAEAMEDGRSKDVLDINDSDRCPLNRVKQHESEEPPPRPSHDAALIAHQVEVPPLLRLEPLLQPIDGWNTWTPRALTQQRTIRKLSKSPSSKQSIRIQIQNEGKTGFRRDIQGDSGANTSATNDRNILWSYRQYKRPLPLVTYSESSDHLESQCLALGEGIIRIILEDDSVIDFTALYVPSATGTIISPEHYMQQHDEILHWVQEASKYEGGYIHFLDKDRSPVATLNMRSENGLWFTTNQTYVRKQQLTDTIIKSVSLPTIPEVPADPSKATWAEHDNLWQSVDHSTLTELSVELPQAYPPDPPEVKSFETLNGSWTSHIATAATHLEKKESELKITQGIKHLELWHQRMGHIHPRTLVETSKHVEGMPAIPTTASYFHCPFCDKAKLRKRDRKKSTTRESFRHGTTFHMDFGFISGPPNLEEMVNKGMRAKEGLCKDRHGNTAFLLIICATTRYVWAFPLKSKHPPISIIDQFLKKHGCAHGRKSVKKITTTPGGILAKSRSFDRLLAVTHRVEKEEAAFTLNMDNGKPMDPTVTLAASTHTDTPSTVPTDPSDPSLHQHVVRTDQGGELANSTEVQNTISNHGYMLESTGPDSSSQNGMAERPNRTLKERVRCLLYTAGLGTEFWSDALLHAVWLYNRTFHRAIDHTPFESWTGRKPLVADILTFGTKLTAKVPGKRQPALVPHHYDGIFLGYTASMSKVRYWDVHNNNEKTAHHAVFDEFHYGSDPTIRPPAARHLVEVFTGSPQAERSSHNLKETPRIVTQDDTPTVPVTNEQLIEESPPSYMAQIKKMEQLPIQRTDESLVENIRNIDVTLDLCDPAISELIPLHESSHPTCGLEVASHPEYVDTVVLKGILPGTVASKTIRNWKSRLRHSIIRMIDGIDITSTQQLREVIQNLRTQKRHHSTKIRIHFARPRWANMNGEGIPTLAFDQLNVIAHHLSAMRNNQRHSWQNTPWPELRDQDLDSIVRKGVALPKMTRRKLKQRPEEWPAFQKSEWTQLDKYHNQGMFGEPVPKPRDRDAVILPWVWSYVYKADPLTKALVAKSRGTCNGGQRYGKIVTLAETYAACVEQHAHRLFWALVANQNYTCLGADVGNAFAEADGPEKTFYMYADEPFREWWTQHLKRDPLPPGYVIPIRKNLQGHPEGPRLWNKHVDKLLCDPAYGLNFQQTTHEPCLYYKYDENNELILMLRQVDDFLIAGPTHATCNAIRDKIQGHMKNKLNDLGTVQLYNGIDIDQTQDYIKLSCESYIDKIIAHHGWENEVTATIPIPMRSDSQSLRALQEAKGPTDPKEHQQLQDEMQLNYRQCIGELIYAMSTCRVDIAAATIQLSQFSAAPAAVHYKAVKQIFLYLKTTKSWGLHYWRPEPRMDLPKKPAPQPVTDLSRLDEFPSERDPHTVYGASDATWAADRLHRRSVSGTALLLSGAVIYYRCQIQPTVALSSTESEFAAMADAGKASLYIRSILEEIGLTQTDPTTLHADNHGAICLANAQQPTRRTKHIDIKQMVILQWTEEDKLSYSPTPTENNIADSLTKPLGRIKFHEQNDILMGRRQPLYSRSAVVNHLSHSCSTNKLFTIFELQDCLDSVSVGR